LIPERVTSQDLVYHLGDFAFDDHDPYLELLNWQEHLILGNHGHSDRVKKATRWEGIRELKEIKVGETKIVLCHYAMAARRHMLLPGAPESLDGHHSRHSHDHTGPSPSSALPQGAQSQVRPSRLVELRSQAGAQPVAKREENSA
jgi:calcineurin-like phosphoesterase family protein